MKKQILAAVMAAAMVTGTAGGIIPTSAPMFTSLTASAAEALQLEDGLYKMDIEMIKADHSGYSMSNNAVDHTITLEVKNGKGYITVAFKGLAINDDFGYLKSLSYYDEGYKISKYGKLSGNVKNAEVLSYYTGIVDMYNDVDNPYPHTLKFPLVDGKELDEDGEQYVPLQVFVPIMEAISAGSGTQDVYMSLKWDTLEKKESNLTGTQLSVSGDITMNNYIELSDDLLNDSGAKVITSVNGYETEKLVSSVKGNATENGYAFPIGVPAKDMTSDVTVSVQNGSGEVVDTYTVNVKDYALKIVYGDYTDKQKEMAKALLNYGAYAQKYFGTNEKYLANADLTDSDQWSASDLAAVSFDSYGYTKPTNDKTVGARYMGSCLSLVSKTAIKHYFKANSVDNLTFTVNGKIATPVFDSIRKQYWVAVTGISAANLAQKYDVVVSNGTDSFTLSYSAMDYCKAAQGDSDDNLTNLTKALYLFYNSAK